MDQELLRTIGTFIGPALAAAIVMVGWRRTHNDAMTRDEKTQATAADRDFKNWQRNTLAQTVAPALEEMEKIRHDYENTAFTNEDLERRLRKYLAATSTIQLAGYIEFADEYRKIISSMLIEVNFRRGQREANFHMITSTLPWFRNQLMSKTLDVISDNKIRIIFTQDSASTVDNADKTDGVDENESKE